MTLGLNFETTMQAARVGADWAWTQLYRDLSPAVLRYLRAHNANEAEDLLGETFVHVVRRLASFDGGEVEFRAWVFAIARNLLIDRWRSECRRPTECVPVDVLAADPAPHDTEAEALDRLATHRMTRLLQTLTPEQRDVVFLRIIAGLPIEHVAHIVERSPGAVKSLQSRGLAAIRRGISEEAVS